MNIRGFFALTRVFFLELVREKLVWISVLLGGVLFLFGIALGELSFDEAERIYFHLSVTATHSVGLILMLILGSYRLTREIEKQTCLLLLSRPISRELFYWSYTTALLIFIFLFDLLLILILGFSMESSFSMNSWLMLFVGIFFEQLLVLCLSLMASQSLRPFIAGFFAFGIYLVGHWLPDLKYFAERSGSESFVFIADLIHFVVPHFYRLNFRSFETLQQTLPASDLYFELMHGGGWILLLSVIGSQLWRRRDLV